MCYFDPYQDVALLSIGGSEVVAMSQRKEFPESPRGRRVIFIGMEINPRVSNARFPLSHQQKIPNMSLVGSE